MPPSSRGLGHRPLKAEIEGSNPSGGVPFIDKIIICIFLFGGLCAELISLQE